jgi:hypothetical protein
MSCWRQTRIQNRQKPQRFHDLMFLPLSQERPGIGKFEEYYTRIHS